MECVQREEEPSRRGDTSARNLSWGLLEIRHGRETPDSNRKVKGVWAPLWGAVSGSPVILFSFILSVV